MPPEQAVRPQVHRQNDECAEQEVAPIAEESQSFDEECLNEDHRRERAEDSSQAADDGVGDCERGEQHIEVGVLDMRRVMGIEPAAHARDRPADCHGAYLDRSQIDAHRLRGDLVLADRAQHGAIARAVEPPEQRHHRDHEHPDEQHHLAGGPAVLLEKTDLTKTLAAERADPNPAFRHLVVEVEEEQAHALAEGQRATTSMSPLTRSAGKPTAQAVTAPSMLPTPSAGTTCQPASTVSMPAL